MSISLTYPEADCAQHRNILLPDTMRFIKKVTLLLVATLTIFGIGRMSTTGVMGNDGLVVLDDTRDGTAAKARVQQIYSEFDNGYAFVSGEIVNLSEKSMSNLQIVTEYFDKQSRLLSTEISVPTFSGISQRDSVPFSVLTPRKPGMTSVKISLRTSDGKAVPSICSE